MLNVRVEKTIIPTYEVGEADKNPLFLDKRVYQASSGKIYPYPMIDKIYDEKVDKEYEVIILENDYIEIMVMPSLGGRIQYGYDKVNDYYFFYNNEVIKPALVGLCGPWISGGVEFNWPQHHRPSTYDKVEYDIEYGDGYATVWVNEIEKMSQLIGVAGIKIYEDSNRVEVLGRSVNNTNLPKTFLWWANIAVHCHENYESFFPKDVKFVADHGKREVTSYPYADSQYYNIDYPSYDLEKRNITNYENISVPMSYMAVGSKYDFFGGFDFDKQIGTMHISNTHTAPGKKQWTWGSGKFGQAWDRHLTDENGPYVELMAGVYTDNQPDFTWISPGETKEFKQTWYPFAKLGKAINANELIAYNVIDSKLVVFSTVDQDVTIKVITDGIQLSEKITLAVGEIKEVMDVSEKEIEMIDVNGLIYEAQSEDQEDFQPAIEAPFAEDVKSIDELYNIGLHLEQYRHATRNPQDYYFRMLEIDPVDARANTRLGYINLEKGEIEKAIEFFKTAVATLTKYNPNPIDGSAHFGLGSAYKHSGDLDLAYKNYHKSIWDLKFKSKGYLELAKLDLKQMRVEKAYENILESLKYDQINIEANTLLLYVEESKGKSVNYSELYNKTKYNYFARYLEDIHKLIDYIGENDKTILELVEFSNDIGLVEKALELIEVSKTTNPVLLAYASNNGVKVDKFIIENVFPYTVFERLVMERYLESNTSNEISFLLAILLIDKGVKIVAHDILKKCYESGYKNSVFTRVLALCEYNISKDAQSAKTLYLEAIKADPSDHRLVYEYDQLCKLLNEDPNARLDYLRTHPEAIEYRDDLKAEYAWLLCQLNQFKECIDYMESTKFHPFEGGEGKVIEVYKTAKLGIVNSLIEDNEVSDALEILETINDIPHCLGEDIIFGSPNADVLYLTGLCHKHLGNDEVATELFKKCAKEQVITTSKLSYKPEKLQMNYYQALANEQLGNVDFANKLINDLEVLANEKLEVEAIIDYFAISVPEFSIFDADLNAINRAHCYYLLALCKKANGDSKAKEEYIKECIKLNRNKLELVLV